ncbi:MAG TPA: Mur ligase family protein [Candidatus Bipolaricaulota bacterium]|nr:Mur ligase family protein [Candidatus Bipolaricaulota bacterium]
MTPYKKYNQALDYLISLSNIKKDAFFSGCADPKHYLKRAQTLFKLAGNPEKSAKKIIVVTGTSGKGSTVDALRQILFEAGKNVGAYYSPHSTTAIERIKVGDKYISPDEFARLVERMKPIIEKCFQKFDLPSFFEIFTLLALMYFKEKKCDYIIVEVGCGGRHDAANAMSRIDIAAIINIGHDHLHIIGPTLTDVAFEKAGIIHRNTCFTTEKNRTFLKIFENEAKKTKSKLIEVKFKDKPNQALASSIAKHLKINDEFIEKGLKKSGLPCRFEIIQKNPLVIIDSAHNPEKIKYLSKKLNTQKAKRLKIIFALSSPKNIKACLKPLLDNFDCEIFATRFLVEQRQAINPFEIQRTVKKVWPKTKCRAFLDPWQAFDAAKKNLSKNQLLLITGSTFLCGELRKSWISEEWILQNRKSF